jgi:hypothetical protein
MNMTLREQHSLLRSGLMVVQGLGEFLLPRRTAQWGGGLDKLTRLARLACWSGFVSMLLLLQYGREVGARMFHNQDWQSRLSKDMVL